MAPAPLVGPPGGGRTVFRTTNPAAALPGLVGAPQSPQNFWLGPFMAPHVAHFSAPAAFSAGSAAASTFWSAARRTAEKSSASRNLSFGAFESERSTTSTIGSGMCRSGAMTRGSGGAAVRCMSTTCVGDSASNGRWPVRSWKRMTPTP